MELIKPLLLFYSCMIVINIALMTNLWLSYKHELYRWSVLLWISILVNFSLQGIFDQNPLTMILSFSTYYACALILVRILQLTTPIKLPYRRYHLTMACALFISITAYLIDLSFTLIALPVAIAIATPMLHAAFSLLRQNKAVAMAKIYSILLILNGLHFLDYPFLRAMPDMTILGFSFAFGITLLMSIYLPIFTSKSISDRHTLQLEEEIKQRRRVEKHLTKARKQAEVANQAKSEFLTNMSHELRTPLNGIMGTTELLTYSDLGKEDLELAQVAHQSSKNLLETIEKILNYSTLDLGQTSLNYTPLTLQTLGRKSIESVEQQAAAKDLPINLVISSTCPEQIMGDSKSLQQIITALLENAIKFTKQGSISLRISNNNQATDDAILFEVEDSGIGIANNKLDGIFEFFHQADMSSTRQYGGTGLGLSISYKLVELMAGKLEVRSQLDQGSVFYFTLRSPKIDK